MKIGLIGFTKNSYEGFCKKTLKQQIEFMSDQGDYKHMDDKVRVAKINEALKNVKHATERAKKQAKKVDTNSDRVGSSEVDSKG